jgi:hypothetical protein
VFSPASPFSSPWIGRGEPKAGVLPISIGSAMVLLRRGNDGRDDMKRGGASVKGSWPYLPLW